MSNSRVSTWSGLRNKLENDYLCPALRGRIQYFATSYSKSADHEGRAAIRLDGVEVLRSNYYTYFENVWTKFHHLRSTTLKDHDSAKEAINQAHAYALEQGTFDQKVFYEAFLNALVVKDPKRLIEHLLVKGTLFQRIGMSPVDGLFCGVVIFQGCGPQMMK